MHYGTPQFYKSLHISSWVMSDAQALHSIYINTEDILATKSPDTWKTKSYLHYYPQPLAHTAYDTSNTQAKYQTHGEKMFYVHEYAHAWITILLNWTLWILSMPVNRRSGMGL